MAMPRSWIGTVAATATATDATNATVVITLDGTVDEHRTRGHQVELAEGPNEISVEVTAEDKTTTQTYDAHADPDAVRSTDSSLSALGLKDRRGRRGVQHRRSSLQATLMYSASVERYGNDRVDLTATPAAEQYCCSYRW